MKKIVFCICGAAIIALSAINLNLVSKSDKSSANFVFAGIVSLAKSEDSGNGKCRQAYGYDIQPDRIVYHYSCLLDGSDPYCDYGWIAYIPCGSCPSGWKYCCDGFTDYPYCK